jgi:ABC-type bacteriocin/lantibiotic exporter with double-glycine peptidase domain
LLKDFFHRSFAFVVGRDDMWLFIDKTPSRLQVDPIECGAVCLGIILEHLGYYATNLRLRQSCFTSRHGSEAVAIIKGALDFGLTGEAKKILASDLKSSRTPAILFFDQCHFVVFEGYFLGRYYINDPARGRYSLDRTTFHQRFSKIVIFFSKNEHFRVNQEQDEPKTTYALAKVSLIFLGIFWGLIFAIFASLSGLLLSDGLKNLALTGWMASAGLLIVVLLGLLSLVILGQIINHLAIEHSHTDTHFLTKALTLVPVSFFDDVPFASFVASFSSSSDRSIMQFKLLSFRYFCGSFLMTIAVVAVFILPINIAIITFVVFLFSVQFYAIKAYRPSGATSLSRRELSQAIALSSDMNAMGQQVFLLDGLLTKRINLLPSLLDKTSRIIRMTQPWIIPSAVLLLLLALVLPWAWHKGDINLAEVFANLFLGFAIIIGMVSWLSDHEDTAYHEALAFRRELLEQLRLSEKIIKTSDADNLITLKNVIFSYRGEQKPAFGTTNLVLKRGHIIGVVGPSLSGKSTLMRLIGGKIIPSDGHIIHGLYQSHPLRIAMIDDDTGLVSANLRDIVTLFDQASRDESVVKALEQACATDLFYRRPLGLLTPIAEHGANISESERKRLLLAQILAHAPDLVVLDDVLRSLDDNTSTKIISNLKSLGITTVFNSFRFSELELCDSVIFMNPGAAPIVGSHEHLLRSNQDYQNLLGLPVLKDRV